MARTLVIQSYRPNPASWLTECRRTVKEWAFTNKYNHETADDNAFFGALPSHLRSSLITVSTATASDAARLYWMRKLFATSSTDRIIWVDDDVLMLGDGPVFPLGKQVILNRELWLFRDSRGMLARTSAVNNAMVSIERHAVFLDFYIWAIEQMASSKPLHKTSIGPDFLTHLAKQIPIHVIASVPTVSPTILFDIVADRLASLDSITYHGLRGIRGAHFCGSVTGHTVNGFRVTNDLIDRALSKLLDSFGKLTGGQSAG